MCLRFEYDAVSCMQAEFVPLFGRGSAITQAGFLNMEEIVACSKPKTCPVILHCNLSADLPLPKILAVHDMMAPSMISMLACSTCKLTSRAFAKSSVSITIANGVAIVGACFAAPRHRLVGYGILLVKTRTP